MLFWSLSSLSPGDALKEGDVVVVEEVVGDTPRRACRARERAGDEGTRWCCQYRTSEDRDHHEPFAPELDGVAEKASVIGRCVEVVRRFVGVDEVALRRKKLSTGVQIKIDCNSGGEVMVD
jgi:hypothetical protein